MKKNSFFQEAFRLAVTAKGNTSPNPAVGCVIVKEGRIIARGVTQPAGSDHAEAAALKEAGEAARGSEMYVTLEPCVDFPGKRTPGCAQAIVRAGISKVYVGMIDPNPHVNRAGIRLMKQSGVECEMAEDFQDELLELNEDFFRYVGTGKPFVTAKAAITLDGNLASSDGVSQWVSCAESRDRVQEMRRRSDAVMVGVGTVIADNPSLNVRLPGVNRQPLRVIIDPAGRTPPESKVLNDGGKTLLVTGGSIPAELERKIDGSIVRVRNFPLNGGKIDLKRLYADLAAGEKIVSIFMEGGGGLFHEAFRQQAIDKWMIFIAPKMLGGRGITLFQGENQFSMPEALKIRGMKSDNIGSDLCIWGYPEWPMKSETKSTGTVKPPF